MTAVASPPSLQPLQHLGWNNGDGQDEGAAVDSENASRIFLPRKALQRQNSASSIASDSSTNTTISTNPSTNTTLSDPEHPVIGRKAPLISSVEREVLIPTKRIKTLWPVQKGEGAAAGHPNRPTASQGAQGGPGGQQQGHPGPLNNMQNAQQAGNGRAMPANGGSEPQALLVLVPMNATFERKSIQVPTFPEILRIGRQTNAKTVPTPANGYFDSKVLSRQHAEVWADRNGKVWIRDVKSSNGTFVNGTRLSPESRDSEPHELRENDSLELGIDIVSEDQKSIVHHKVSAKVEHAGFPNSSSNVMDLNFGDIDPGANSGLITSSANGLGLRPRLGSQNSAGSMNGLHVQNGLRGPQGLGVQRHMNAFLQPVTVESVMKQLNNELRKAKQQSQEIQKTGEFFSALLSTEPGQQPPKAPEAILPAKPTQVNHLYLNGIGPSNIDPLSPFSAPPAPPPQLPLPEKPDGPRSANPEFAAAYRRSAPDLPHLPNLPHLSNGKHEPPPSSQILSLVDTLNSTRKELDVQGSRVKELEELLKQERKARELAEERARILATRHPILNGSMSLQSEKADPYTPPLEELKSPETNGSDHADEDMSDTASETETIIIHAETVQPSSVEEAKQETANVDASTTRIQERLAKMLGDMEGLQKQLEEQRSRADSAETERDSLVTMIQRIRDAEPSKTSPKKRNEKAFAHNGSLAQDEDDLTTPVEKDSKLEDQQHGSLVANGKPNAAELDKDKQITELTDALAQALTRTVQSQSEAGSLGQSAPYASMVGVVLVGMAAMMYLNGWQKVER